MESKTVWRGSTKYRLPKLAMRVHAACRWLHRQPIPRRAKLVVFRVACALFAFAMAAGCASAPEIKADNVKDGTVVCGTLTGIYGTGKTVVVKLDERVIRDGGSVSVDPNCVVTIQLAPPLPKPVKPEPAAK